MAEKQKIGDVQEIRYFRTVKAPTLKQYLHRRAVSDVMSQVKSETGLGRDTETGRIIPISAIKAKEMLKGVKAEDLMKLHQDWVEDYRREYGT